MSKTKAVPQTNGHKIKGDKVKSSTKDAVTAKTATKLNGKTRDSKKSSEKAPPPPVESSDSESDSDAESEGSSASSASDDSEIEAETVSKPAAAAKAKVNGAASKKNGAKPSAAESDDSSSEGSASEGSDSDAEAPVAKAAKAAKPSAAKDDSSSDDSGSDSDEVEAPAKSGTTPKGSAVDVKMADASSDDDDEDGDSSDSSSDDEAAPKKAAAVPAPAQKRKADAIEETPAKKAKTVNGTTNLFVGSLSWNIDEDWLKREFEHFGTVKGCRVITDRESGRSKGFGYVDFEDAAVAQKAHDEMKGYELDGRAINVDFAQPKTEASPGGFKARANDRGNQYGDQLSPPSDTLFVANLSFESTADSLRERFEQYGDITRISLPTHQDSGQPKGIGYIGFGSVAEATAALEANKGQEIDGRPVRFDYASPRPDNGGDRGGRGGGFRGGRGDRGGGRGGGFRGGRGDRGGGRGGGFRGGRGDRGGGRGGSTNRGGVGDFSGKKMSF